MRDSRIAIAAWVVCLVGSEAAQAGLYNTNNLFPQSGLANPQFRLLLGELQRLPIPPQNATADDKKGLWGKYREQLAELQAQERTLGLTVEDRVNLGECLIRLQQPQLAVEVLKPAADRRADNFMVYANLAMAYQLVGQWDRAIDAEREALKLWPRRWPGLSSAQLARLRRAETAHLELMQLRRQESFRQRPGMPQTELKLDALFPGVRFVGRSGGYEPGELAEEQRAKLPPDALETVQQLVLWLPHDFALQWLLAELLNAQGQVEEAAEILWKLVFNTRVDAPELMQHRKVLNAARKAASELGGWQKNGQLLWCLVPRDPAQGVGLSPLAQEAVWSQIVEELKRRQDPTLALVVPALETKGAANEPEQRADWLPGGPQLLLVGAIAGLVVAALGYFQVREVLRRRIGGAPARGK